MARPLAFICNLGVALVLLVAASAAQPQGVTSTTIVLGQSAPLSGANKSLGDDIRNGALAYFKKVNDAGGVNGRRIELVTLDDAVKSHDIFSMLMGDKVEPRKQFIETHAHLVTDLDV